MGIFDRFTGSSRARSEGVQGTSDDERAIERYRYLLRTAPPEAIEQTHAEAFARLTPEQRRQVLGALSSELPEAERAAALRGGEAPGALARVATRAEMRQPGSMERAFGRMNAGPGLGGLMAGSFLSTMAGAVLGTAIGHSLFGGDAAGGSQDFGIGDASADAGDIGGDFGGGDIGGFDV